MFKKVYGILVGIDSSLLKACTVFSHWLQRNFGITNFFVARFGLFMCVLSLALTVVSNWWKIEGVVSSNTMVILSLVMLVGAWYDISFTHENEKRLYQGQTLLQSPRLMRDPVISRMVWLAFSTVDLIKAISTSEGIFGLIGNRFLSWGLLILYYFLSVTPLPPGMSRLRKFVDSLTGFGRKPVEVTSS